jgi:hypothetical protein
MSVARSKSDDVALLAEQAYIYGYPLVLMAATRDVMTATGNDATPINHFNHKRTFPDASFTDVVSPNADTLYSVAWLDLHRQPMVLSVPATDGRYYLMQLLSGWTDVFASIGKRTTGTAAGRFVIVGPSWQGKLPGGMQEIRSPTEMVWLIGRTQTNGPADYAAVRALQDQYRLMPLDERPVDSLLPTRGSNITPPAEQVAKMEPATFFGGLAALLPTNPATSADASALGELARLGVRPGVPFRAKSAQLSALAEGVNRARAAIERNARNGHNGHRNGWTTHLGLGTYGTDYLTRAAVAMWGLGANLPADAVYAQARTDSQEHPLQGANQYCVHFAPGQTPPVDAFWSVTLYNDRQFFERNPIDRYAIGDRDDLQFNPDGSLDLHVQHAMPDEPKRKNWLPAPNDGAFNLVLRMYEPKREILDDVWQPPQIVPQRTA